MIKKFFMAIIILMLLFCNNVFAYHWVNVADNWYVIDENTMERMNNTLLDTGENVYYLDDTGKMVIGWWRNPTTNKIYFFDNNIDREYGAMVFGLHMIDGYYRYFADDGSLQTSDDITGYKNVYGDYWADVVGNLYNNNKLVQDTSISKSEYYTNALYYTNENLNNYYLATYDAISVLPQDLIKIEKSSGSKIILDQSSGDIGNAMANASGGNDYYVDGMGHVIVPDKTGQISNYEVYGPANYN